MGNKKNSLVSGAVLAGMFLSAAGMNAYSSDLFKYNELGSGAQVRTNLSADESASHISLLAYSDDNKKSTTKPATKPAAKKEVKGKEGKCGEHKCGEGKCGEGKTSMKKTDMKMDTKKDVKSTKSEAKTKEGKCGEGKCGN